MITLTQPLCLFQTMKPVYYSSNSYKNIYPLLWPRHGRVSSKVTFLLIRTLSFPHKFVVFMVCPKEISKIFKISDI